MQSFRCLNSCSIFPRTVSLEFICRWLCCVRWTCRSYSSTKGGRNETAPRHQKIQNLHPDHWRFVLIYKRYVFFLNCFSAHPHILHIQSKISRVFYRMTMIIQFLWTHKLNFRFWEWNHWCRLEASKDKLSSFEASICTDTALFDLPAGSSRCGTNGGCWSVRWIGGRERWGEWICHWTSLADGTTRATAKQDWEAGCFFFPVGGCVGVIGVEPRCEWLVVGGRVVIFWEGLIEKTSKDL